MDCYSIAANVGPPTKAAPTNIAHTISQPLSEDIRVWHGITPAHQPKFQWARTAGAMVEHFGGFDARDVLGQDLVPPQSQERVHSVGRSAQVVRSS
ncbi:hypothetical protein L227DRAFT_194230 [Lentinus tigrinus ALCF2SS1-6]|uniref:Uncharacterized protein n=2 Tax=Lentinus tigrinus TaxID=5365 RepID=A0A5C2S3F2_9APHY|nr:hypothetical protein L227DRAFT_194230 [Lentinus tigrinus ALCF2SS1-6]